MNPPVHPRQGYGPPDLLGLKPPGELKENPGPTPLPGKAHLTASQVPSSFVAQCRWSASELWTRRHGSLVKNSCGAQYSLPVIQVLVASPSTLASSTLASSIPCLRIHLFIKPGVRLCAVIPFPDRLKLLRELMRT